MNRLAFLFLKVLVSKKTSLLFTLDYPASSLPVSLVAVLGGGVGW